jgi:hypothetical protein
MDLHVDTVVVGGGPSGIAAALSSAAAGSRTLLVERSATPGGMVSAAHITTLCGLYVNRGNAGAQLVYDGVVQEIIQKLTTADTVTEPVLMGRVYILPCRPASFCRVSAELLATHKNLDCWYGATLREVRVEHRGIHSIIVQKGDHGVRVIPRAVIDCSGDAVVSRLAKIPCQDDGDDDQAAAVVLPISRVTAPLNTTTDRLRILLAVKHAVDEGLLAKGSEYLSLVNSLDSGTVCLKLNLTADTARRSAGPLQMAAQLLNFLKKEVAGFGQCDVAGDAGRVVRRDSRRLAGKYVLTGADVLGGRSFPDPAARGCWPIEKWTAAGKQTLRYVSEGTCYQIPVRSLQSVHLDNLFAAGKTMSADRDAIASARVVGTCLATGAAAGTLAAAC